MSYLLYNQSQRFMLAQGSIKSNIPYFPCTLPYCDVDSNEHIIICFFRLNGLLGYYRGLSPNLMRVVPATALTFVVYEKTSHFLLQFRKSEETDEEDS